MYHGGNGKILLVDDEPNTLKMMSALLTEWDYQVSVAPNVETAIRTVQSSPLDVVVSDIQMPDQDGMVLFEFLSQRFPEIPVIFLTAFPTVDAAVQAMAQGAYYYLAKPPNFQNLQRLVAKAVDQHRQKQKPPSLPLQEKHTQAFRLLGNDPATQEVLRIIHAVKDSNSSILLYGETGTGKELIANYIHFQGSRKNCPFVAVNCPAIPSELIESELFGCEKGAYTGAVSRRAGRVEQASGGTLFLDEIGEMNPAVQAKFLRVLQEKEIERLGGGKKIGVDFRLISSTNRDLREEVEKGFFREDLFYRINVVELRVPPLRDRKKDIPLLVNEFIKEFNSREGKTVVPSKELMDFFSNYHWPGNIRQLRNVVERAVVLGEKQKICLKDIPRDLLLEESSTPDASIPTIREREFSAVQEAIERCGGNKSRAAQALGISRKYLYKKLREIRHEELKKFSDGSER